MSDMRYAIIIPAFNEERTIRPIVRDCLRYCKNVVVIDDGSTDNTVTNIQDLPITILQNTLNRGKDLSLLRGLLHLQNHQLDAIITLDADGQHEPKDIPRFLMAHRHYNQNIIIGARRINIKEAPRLRLFANRIADFFISWAAGKKILDTQSGFRLYPVSYIRSILRKSQHYGKFVFESKVLIDATRKSFTPVSLPIASLYPKNARTSYFHPIVDTGRIVLMITWQLLSRGLYPKGLWLALAKPAEHFESET